MPYDSLVITVAVFAIALIGIVNAALRNAHAKTLPQVSFAEFLREFLRSWRCRIMLIIFVFFSTGVGYCCVRLVRSDRVWQAELRQYEIAHPPRFNLGERVRHRTDGREGVVVDVWLPWNARQRPSFLVRFPATLISTNTHILSPDEPLDIDHLEEVPCYEWELDKIEMARP